MPGRGETGWWQVAARVGAFLFALPVLAVLLLQWSPVATRAADALLPLVVPWPQAVASVGHADLDGLRALTLEGVRVRGARRGPDGRPSPTISLERVEASFRLLPLLGRRLVVRALELSGIEVRTARRADATWDLQADTRGTRPERGAEGEGWTVEIGRLTLSDASLRARYGPDPDSVLRVDDLGLHVRGLRLGADSPAAVLDTAHAVLRPPGPDPAPVRVSAALTLDGGRLSVEGFRLTSRTSDVTARGHLLLPISDSARVRDVDFRFAAEPLDLRDIGALLPGFDVPGSLRLHARARGSSRLIDVELRGRGSDGSRVRLEGTLTPSTRGPLHYELKGEVVDLNPALWGGPEAVSGVDATMELALAGPSPDSLSGRVLFRAEADALGDGALEGSRLAATLRRGTAEFELSAAASPWGRIEATGSAGVVADVPWYDVRATLAQGRTLRIGGTDLEDAVVAVRMDGRGIRPEEASGRATADLTGTLGGVELHDARLTGRWEDAAARADLTLSLDAGRVEAALEAEWGGEAVRLELPTLTARSLDVATLLGDSVSGTLTLEGSGSMVLGDPASPRADLEGSFGPLAWVGETVLDSGRVGLEVRRGSASLQAGLFGPAGRATLAGSAEPFEPARPWEIDRLHVAELDLSQARPGLPRTDLEGILHLEGRFPVEEGTPSAEVARAGTGRSAGMTRALVAQGRLSLRPSTVGAQRVDTADVLLSFADGLLEVTGVAEALAGRVTLDGRATPVAEVPTFRVERLRIEGVRVDSALAGPLSGTVTGTLRVHGAVPPGELPRLEGELELEPSPLDVGQVLRGRASFRVANARARLEAVAGVRRGSAELTAMADLARAPGGAPELEAFELDGRVELRDAARALGSDTIESALDARFAGSGSARAGGGLDWTGSVSAVGRLGGARLDRLELAVRSAEGVLHLDTLILASNVARAEGGGAVALGDTLGRQGGIRARLVLDNLHAAGALSAVRPLSLRGGAAELTATNPAGDVRVEVTLAAGGLLAADFAADTLAAEGAIILRDGEVWTASGRFGGENLGWGSAFVDLVSGELAHHSGTTRFAVTALPNGAHELAVAGTAHTEDRTIELEELRLSFPDEEWTLARRATVAWGDTVQVGGLALVSGGRRIAVDGTLNRNGEQDLTVTLDSVSFDAAAELAGLGGVSALLDGSVRVLGPADDVALDGAVTGRIGDAVALDVSFRPEGADLGVQARLSTGGRMLEARGTVPFPLSIAEDADEAPAGGGALALTVTAEAFALGWLTPFLEPLGVAEWRAWLTAAARVGGTLEDPRVAGSASLVGGALRVPEQGVSYQDISAEVSLAGDRVEVHSLHLSAGGSADVTGTIHLAAPHGPEFEVRARLDRFRAVHNEWTRLGLSGDLAVSGSIRAPVVRGSVSLVDTDIFADAAGTAAGGQPIELTPADYEMLERYFGLTPGREEAVEGDPLEPLAMDMVVELESDVWLRRESQPEMRLQLEGSLDVRKQAGDSIQLFGTIEILPARSYVEELGRRFDVTMGTATFNGSIRDWQADIQARYEVPSIRDPTAPEVTITLEVTGGLEDLQVTLGSEPDMETADILSYIATGRPAASAVAFGQPEGGRGGGGGVVGVGASLALEQAASALERTAAETVGLDVVEIRHGGRGGATLIAGRYVSPRLFVGFEQPLTLGVRGDDAVTGTVRTTEVEIEYTAYEWLLLTLEGGQSTIRFFLRTRHAF